MTLDEAILHAEEVADRCALTDGDRRCEEDYRQLAEWLRELKRMHWIPVTKRLPEQAENNDYYLVTIQCEHVDGWDDYVTGIAEWTTHGWDSLSCYLGEIKVVAWSELPEPYKEVTE